MLCKAVMFGRLYNCFCCLRFSSVKSNIGASARGTYAVAYKVNYTFIIYTGCSVGLMQLAFSEITRYLLAVQKRVIMICKTTPDTLIKCTKWQTSDQCSVLPPSHLGGSSRDKPNDFAHSIPLVALFRHLQKGIKIPPPPHSLCAIWVQSRQPHSTHG